MLKPYVAILAMCGFWGLTPASHADSSSLPQKTALADSLRVDLQRKGTIQQFETKSKYTSHEYLVQVYIPFASAPKEGYPVLYLLDGNAIFKSASSIAQSLGGGSDKMGLDPVVIVAIGYPGETQFAVQQRALDYTPVPSAEAQNNAKYQYGGAENFLKFIQNELKPRIQHDIPINTRQQTLFGHSFGGLFALNTFFKHPQSFNRYVAASPSLWFDHDALAYQLKQQKQNKTSVKSPVFVMTTVGTAEGRNRAPSNATQQETNAEFFKAFSELKSGQLKYWHFRQPAEQHITNMYASLPKAVLLAGCNSTEHCQKLFDEN